MNISQKINMALAYKGMSQAALARAIGMTPSNFNQKYKRQTFTQEELEQIATVLGGTYVFGFEFPDGSPYRIRLVNTSRGYMLTDGGCAMRYLGANLNFDNADIVREVKRICAGFGMAIRKSQLFFPVSEGVGIVKSLMMFVAAIGRLADVANQNVIAAASEEMLWACAYEFRELLLKNRRDSRKELIKIIKDIVSQAKKKKDYRKILIFLCLKDGLEQITDSYYDQIKKQQLNLFCDD